jgi:SNF2 family DNA or RNA helicase
MDKELELKMFETPTPLELAQEAINKSLSQLNLIHDEENDLLRKLNALRDKKVVIAGETQKLRTQIYDLEREQRKNDAEKERLKALRKEAEEMEEYSIELDTILAGTEAWAACRHYQKEDLAVTLKAFKDQKSGVINGNDMSMGKTFEAVLTMMVLLHFNPDAKFLWLTKDSLTLSTPHEIMRWFPDARIVTSAVMTGKAQRELLLDFMDMGFNIMVANYEFVTSTPKIFDTHFDYLIIDEAHKLKGGANPGKPTAIWTYVNRLCQNMKFSIFLTGTPMVNRSEEMWSYLHIFDPVRFPNLRQFQRQFNVFKSYSDGTAQASSTLLQLLKGQMFRRTCEEVGLELPDIQRIPRILKMLPQQREAYDQMLKFFYIWLEEQGDEPLTATAILAQLIRLRQINVWPDNIVFKIKDEDGNVIGERTLNIKESSKIDEAMDIIDELEEHEQVVLFSTFNEPLVEMQRRIREAGYTCRMLTGDNTWEVGALERDFQQGKIKVLLMNSAVGEGLNLHKDKTKWPGGARYGIMLDKWYSPARNDQCYRRIVRPGSTDKGAFYFLENESSVDTFINLLNEEKQASFDTITNSGAIRHDWKQYLKDKL